jgi:hypothetical protein
VPFPDRVRLPFRFDADALARDAHGIDESAWERHFNTGYYEGDWSGVALRSTGGRLSLYPDPASTASFQDTPALALCPAVRAVLATLRCPHRVANQGPQSRVHLVVDCVVDDWLREVLMRAAGVRPSVVGNER